MWEERVLKGRTSIPPRMKAPHAHTSHPFDAWRDRKQGGKMVTQVQPHAPRPWFGGDVVPCLTRKMPSWPQTGLTGLSPPPHCPLLLRVGSWWLPRQEPSSSVLQTPPRILSLREASSLLLNTPPLCSSVCAAPSLQRFGSSAPSSSCSKAPNDGRKSGDTGSGLTPSGSACSDLEPSVWMFSVCWLVLSAGSVNL